MTNREKYLNEIISYLNLLQNAIELNGSIQLRNSNIICENIYRDLLNKVYNMELINLNHKEKVNYPGIDLGDKSARKAYQITSSVTREKINDSINKFSKYVHEYDELYIFFLLPKTKLEKKSGKIGEFESTFDFSIEKHVLDNSDLLKEINNLTIDKIKDICELVRKELAGLIPVNNHSTEILDKKIDEWRQFATNSVISANDKEIKGYDISKFLCQEMYQELQKSIIYLGRVILWKKYDDNNFNILGTFFLNLYREYYSMSRSKKIETDIDQFMLDMSNKSEGEKWNEIKNYVGSVGVEREQGKEALRAVASVCFYDIDYNSQGNINRKTYYREAIGKVYAKYDVYFQPYITILSGVLNEFSKIPDPATQIDKLNAIFYSNFDLLIVLYLVSADILDPKVVSCIRKWVKFSRIETDMANYMIDLPDKITIKNEIKNILSSKMNKNME